jgi:hypothetical protein
MKNIFITIAAAFFVLVQSSCSKEPTVNKPQPSGSNYFKLEIKQLPPGNSILQEAHVVVTVINENNEEVIRNRKLRLTYNGTYTTDRVFLPTGLYRISAFIIKDKSDSVKYAAPFNNSLRATEVTKPLHIGFSLPSTNDLTIPVEVAKLQTGDQPSHFGYPAGSFGAQTGEPASETITIKVRGSLQIGDVLYDSMPSMLKITVWNKENQATIENRSLEAGVNQVMLPVAANKYSLQYEKWGYAEEKLIDPATIDTINIYQFNGIFEARRLFSELTYRVVDGRDVAESKTAYFYNQDKSLDKVVYYQKKNDGTPFIVFADSYSYTGSLIQNIRRKDDTGTDAESTVFVRNAEGEAQAITHSAKSGIITNASISYRPIPEGRDIQVKYQFSDNSNQVDYNMRFAGGNMIESAAAIGNGTSELGTYQYDTNVNPYALIHLEDLLFTHSSKNNMIAQFKQYNGSYPTADVYSFEYTYDNFGYPTQLIRKYKSVSTNLHAYTLKTIYHYE